MSYEQVSYEMNYGFLGLLYWPIVKSLYGGGSLVPQTRGSYRQIWCLVVTLKIIIIIKTFYLQVKNLDDKVR